MAAKLHKGQLVTCVDSRGRWDLRPGATYEVEAIYGEVLGRQYVYLLGISDPLPFRSDRFTPAMEDTNG